VSVDNLAKFNAALPDCQKVDVGIATMRMRMLKSPEEVAVIREGARIADLGGAAVAEVLADGIPEHEVALASTRVMVREIAKCFPNSDIMDSK
jgi:creatinase